MIDEMLQNLYSRLLCLNIVKVYSVFDFPEPVAVEIVLLINVV